jgi:hypothetical protein
MNRALRIVFLLSVVAGCQLPPEHLPVPPLPEKGEPIPYADVLLRARLHAASANEAFYVNNWTDLEEAAKGLEQAARFLTKSIEVPAERKATLEAQANELSKDATQLRDAAKAKDEKQTNALLQRINLKVRELRPEK